MYYISPFLNSFEISQIIKQIYQIKELQVSFRTSKSKFKEYVIGCRMSDYPSVNYHKKHLVISSEKEDSKENLYNYLSSIIKEENIVLPESLVSHKFFSTLPKIEAKPKSIIQEKKNKYKLTPKTFLLLSLSLVLVSYLCLSR